MNSARSKPGYGSLDRVFRHLTEILVGSALILMLLTVLALHAKSAERALQDNAMLASDLLVEQIRSALVSSDSDLLAEQFQTISNYTSLKLACLYDASDRLVATSVKSHPDECPQSFDADARHRLLATGSWNSFSLTREITRQQQILGNLVMTLDRNAIWHSTLQLGLILLGIGLVVLILILFAARRVAQPVIRSLGDLTDSAQAFRSGDRSRRMQEQGPEEIRDLARSFNGVIDELLSAQSEATRNSKLLREIIDLVPYLIFAVRREGQIVFVNRAVAELYNTSISRIMKGEFQRAYQGRKPDGLLFNAAVESDQWPDSMDQEVLVEDSDGETHHLRVKRVQVSASSLGDPFELVVGVDVSAEKRLQTQLHFSQRLEVIGTLAGGIAHDFNNLLTPIMGYTTILQESEQNPENQKRLNAIYSASCRARDLVHQILTFSRQRTDTAQKQKLEPGTLARDAVELLRASIPSTTRINLDIGPSSWQVFAEPGQIHQVIVNLVTNAAQAMKDSQGTIVVSVDDIEISLENPVKRLPPGSYVRIRVQDDGRGIDENMFDRIFEPFFTTKEVGEGTGLGLSVVHGIVTAHAGDVEVTSRRGQGSTFSVYLPGIPGPERSDHQDMQGSAAEVRILLVDDETSVLNSTRDLLLHAGYQVDAFDVPEKALANFRKNVSRYQLILTDNVMPGMSGLELARNIRTLQKNIPIVLITGYLTSETDVSDLVDRKLHKPVSIRELSEMVEEILLRN